MVDYAHPIPPSKRGSIRMLPKQTRRDTSCISTVVQKEKQPPSPTPVQSKVQIPPTALIHPTPPPRTERRETKKPVIASLRKPKPISLPSQGRPKRTLSDALSKINAATDNLLSDMKTTFKLEGPQPGEVLYECPSRNLIVGRLDSRYPTTTHFLRDRLEYQFYDPHKSERIKMIMYYLDMVSPILNSRKRTLTFRIGRKLEHFGEDDYDYTNPRHTLQVGFNSDSDIAKIKERCMPTILTNCH